MNDFQVGRFRYLLFAHTWSYVGCVAPARGVTDARSFLDAFVECVSQQLRACQLESVWGRAIEPFLTTFAFAPIPTRSCLGCVNDLIRLASFGFEDGLSPAEVSRQIADVPMCAADIGSPLKQLAAFTNKTS